MRQSRMVMLCVGMILLGLTGCKHQPDLKPPPEPQVLASPGPTDKRYEQPFSYPADTLASDPSKAGSSLQPAGGKRGGSGGMGGMSAGGGPSGTGGY